MDGNIVRLNSETVLEFIQREGRVTTWSVAHRFGWDTDRARRELKRLESAGQIASAREPLSGVGAGGMILGWFVPEEGSRES